MTESSCEMLVLCFFPILLSIQSILFSNKAGNYKGNIMIGVCLLLLLLFIHIVSLLPLPFLVSTAIATQNDVHIYIAFSAYRFSVFAYMYFSSFSATCAWSPVAWKQRTQCTTRYTTLTHSHTHRGHIKFYDSHIAFDLCLDSPSSTMCCFVHAKTFIMLGLVATFLSCRQRNRV